MKARIARLTFDGAKQGLRECPFCGEMPNIIIHLNITFIECKGCGAVVSFEGNESKPATIENYNKRK